MFSTSAQALFNAVKLGDQDLLEELVLEGANPKCVDKDNQTLLHIAAQYGHDHLIIKLIENYQIDVNAVDRYGMSALHLSCNSSQSNLASIKMLIFYKADINKKSHLGSTPLLIACWGDQFEFAKYLIDEGANINETNSDGTTPLHQACFKRNTDTVKLLLKKGANINAENWFGTTLYRTICDLDHIQDRDKIKEIIHILWHHQPKANLNGYNRKLIFMNLLWMWQKNSKTPFISVDLSSRNITDKDLELLVSILKKHPIISKLKLSDNPFSHDGLTYLIESLATNKTLISLDLSHTQIGSNYFFISSGFQRLIRALANNDTLVHLDVRNCVLDKSDIQTLIEFLRSNSNKTLKRIYFDVADEIFNNLSNENQELIRITQNLSDFRGLINQCQIRLAQFIPEDDREKDLFEAIKDYLIKCQDLFSGQEEKDVYLNGVIAGLIEFADIASVNHLVDLNHCLQNILYILYHGRIQQEEVRTDNSIDIFQSFFLNNFNALYEASLTISSTYVKNKIKTPIEKMAIMAKNIILGLSGFGRVVEGSSAVLELAGKHIEDAIGQGAALVSEATEVAHIVEKIHWGLDQTKENLIRTIHGLTEKDKIVNLIHCFKGSQSAKSKIQAICYAISHHYQDIIKKLPPNEAEMLAKYAYLHIAHLLTSGLLTRSQHGLSAEILAEEAILWLAYVPYNEGAIRVDILTKAEKELTENYFMLPRIKFYADREEKNCCISTHYHNKLYIQSTYPTRFATRAEIAALNELLNTVLEFDHSQIISCNKGIKYQFIFNNNEIIELKNDYQQNNLHVETRLSSYQSKSKKMDRFNERLNKLEDMIIKSENEKMEFIKIIKEQQNEILELKHRLNDIEKEQHRSNNSEQSNKLSTSSNNMIMWNSKKNSKKNVKKEHKSDMKQKLY